MNTHGVAGSLEHLFASFERIKAISNSGEIDRLTVNNMATIKNLVDELGIQDEFYQIRERRIDPTM